MDKEINGSSEESSSDEEIRRSKKKSKKSKQKKRKDKKRRKKRKRYSSSSSEESSSEEEWVTKEVPAPTEEVKVQADIKVEDKRERDEWMNMDMEIPTYSNDSKKSKRREEREKQKNLSSIDNLGQSSRELNPYWKDGGTGLPAEELIEKPKVVPTTTIGDGGLSWLRKSYQRAKEQALEENKSIEEIAAIRWGSLEAFYSMLEEAEAKAKLLSSTEDKRRDRYSSSKSSRQFKRPGDNNKDSDEDRSYSRKSSSSRYHSSKSWERSSGRSDQGGGWRKRKESPSKTTSRDKPEHYSRNSRSPPSSRRKRSKSKSISPPRQRSAESPTLINIKHSQPKENKDSENPSEELEEPQEEKVLSDKEMNELGAKILKAELMGNQTLVDELKAKFEASEKARQEFIKSGGTPGKDREPKIKIVTKVIMDPAKGAGGRNRRIKDKPTETHKDGQRVRYFPDDDRQSLQNMFEREKMNTAEDENALFSRLAGKGAKANSEYDVDDLFADKAGSSKSQYKDNEREVRKVLDEEKEYQKTLDDCNWCFDGKRLQKNLVIAMGEKCYLCVPPFQSLTEGHCLIVPMFHAISSTHLDEDVWQEMKKFKQAVVKMYSDADEDAVIIETAVFLKKMPHMYVECIPMPKETGELAPIYFKKAIQECETEWSQNKKLVDLRDRDVRRAVPKGLPYFSVDFGLDSGFAHVIEDERNFPANFAQEIVGGMMELDHHLWRKQKRDDFNTQRAKVMTFLKSWAPYDFTREAN